MTKVVEVAVGVVFNNQRVLIAKRPKGKAHAGLWEFPGGKIEQNESPQVALSRELSEECGIQITAIEPLTVVNWAYENGPTVRLHVFTCLVASGEAVGLEGQAVAWVEPEALRQHQFPEANGAILEAIEQKITYQKGGRPSLSLA